MGARLRAFADLRKRYGEAFRHAWRHRKEMESPERLPYEAQFLPAALSLQETPLPAAPHVTLWLLLTFALLALLWAIFGRIDVVATAQGKIVPSDRTKVIQPFETATIKNIFVTDGQHVQAGDVLIELDATTTNAEKERLEGEMAVALLQVARGRAILHFLDTGAIYLDRPRQVDNVDDVLYTEAKNLLDGQIAEYTSKLDRIDADISRREADLRSTQELIKKLEKTLPIAQRRAKDYKTLVDQKYVSSHEYLQLEQNRIELEADLATQKSQYRANEAALMEGKKQRAELVAETRRITLDTMREGQQAIAALEQELLKASTRDNLMRLTSPVDGTVQQLAIHTVGGVVTPAQAVMVIVPQDSHLEVEAFVENKDIGFVKPNQEAEIKIETFQYTKYGTIPATVVSISHDAINDEKRGLIYSMRVKMERSTIMVEDVAVNLTPGMAVSVEVKTGKRRVIEYFLSPLIQYTTESLRER